MAFWPWTDPPPGETKSLKSLPTCSRSCVRRRWVAALCGAGRPRDNLSIHLGMGVGWDEEQALLWACADEEDIDKVSSREQNYAWWHHLCRSTCIYGAGANFLDASVKPVRPPSCSPSLPLSCYQRFLFAFITILSSFTSCGFPIYISARSDHLFSLFFLIGNF